MNYRKLIFIGLMGASLGLVSFSNFADTPKPAPAAKPASPAAPTAKPAPGPTVPPDEAFKKAQAAYQASDWPTALDGFQNFEKQYPFSSAIPDAMFYQGWCWANQSRYQEAINVFQRLITSYTNNVLVGESMLKQAECYRELKDINKALELYRKFQTQFPQHDLLPQAMLGEALADSRAGNAVAAKEIINLVRERFRNNPDAVFNALFLLGQVYTEAKDFVAANKIYQLITQQRANPRASEALYLAAEAQYNRGETLLRENKTDEGRQAYRDAINFYNNVRTKAELLDGVQKDVEQLKASSGQYVASGNLTAYESRLAALQRLLAQIKDRQDLRVRALFRVANCYQALDMPEEASVVYAFLRDRYPDDKAIEQIYFGLIRSLQDRGQKEKADAEADAFKKKYPNNQGVNNILLVQAESQFSSHRYQEARVNYEKALASTKDATVLETIEFRIATCDFDLEEFAKAQEHFTGFAQKHPDSKIRPDALFYLGLTLYEIASRSNDPAIAKPNIETAIKTYEEIRVKHANYEKQALVTFRLGYLYSYAGAFDRDATGKLTSTANFDKAITTFQELISKWPTQAEAPEAMYQIARNHLAAQRYDQAIAAYKVLLEKFPDHDLAPFAALEIGTTDATAGKKSEMVDAFRYYVQKYPDHAKVGDALYAIATELETENRGDEAVLAWRAIIDRALAATSLTEEARSAAISAQLHISTLLEQRNDPKNVVADCEVFLGKFASDAIAARAMVSQIASIYRKAHLVPDAYATLDRLTQQYQTNAPIRHACLIGTIELAISEKDFNHASAAVARLLADPAHDQMPIAGFLAIANLSLKTGKFEQAKANYEKVVTLAGTDAKLATPATLGIGQALVGLRQFDAAQALLEKALADAANCPRGEAQLALAKVLEGTGKIKEAVDLYSTVMAGRGDAQFEAAYRLGNISFAMVSDKDGKPLAPEKNKDNKKLALAYYARLLFATGPMAEEAAYRSAECHEALGDLVRACPAFQNYVKRFPSGRFVEDAKAKIAKFCNH